jgi:hypothetical protein
MFGGKIFAQQKLASEPHSPLEKRSEFTPCSYFDTAHFTKNCWKNMSIRVMSEAKKRDSLYKRNIWLLDSKPIDKSYYSKNLGFFCQKENQLERTTSIPFRFRLGSLEYVNRLEGKK